MKFIDDFCELFFRVFMVAYPHDPKAFSETTFYKVVKVCTDFNRNKALTILKIM